MTERSQKEFLKMLFYFKYSLKNMNILMHRLRCFELETEIFTAFKKKHTYCAISAYI